MEHRGRLDPNSGQEYCEADQMSRKYKVNSLGLCAPGETGARAPLLPPCRPHAAELPAVVSEPLIRGGKMLQEGAVC
jgi:hypothetical protein